MGGQSGRPIDAAWYPDVAAAGSLASALAVIAQMTGIDLGDIQPMLGKEQQGAVMQSGRGGIAVDMAVAERNFSATLSNNVPGPVQEISPTWASGRTSELGEIAGAAAAWRGGTSLREMLAEFAFLSSNRIALAVEDGTVREVFWDTLFEYDDHPRARPLLVAARADDVIGRTWAKGSHAFWIYFEADDDTKVTARVHLTDDAYVIGPGWGWEDGEDSKAVQTVDEALVEIRRILIGQ